jgi:hypothetical protein
MIALCIVTVLLAGLAVYLGWGWVRALNLCQELVFDIRQWRDTCERATSLYHRAQQRNRTLRCRQRFASEHVGDALVLLERTREERDESERAIHRLPKPPDSMGDGPDERVTSALKDISAGWLVLDRLIHGTTFEPTAGGIKLLVSFNLMKEMRTALAQLERAKAPAKAEAQPLKGTLG